MPIQRNNEPGTRHNARAAPRSHVHPTKSLIYHQCSIIVQGFYFDIKPGGHLASTVSMPTKPPPAILEVTDPALAWTVRPLTRNNLAALRRTATGVPDGIKAMARIKPRRTGGSVIGRATACPPRARPTAPTLPPTGIRRYYGSTGSRCHLAPRTQHIPDQLHDASLDDEPPPDTARSEPGNTNTTKTKSTKAGTTITDASISYTIVGSATRIDITPPAARTNQTRKHLDPPGTCRPPDPSQPAAKPGDQRKPRQTER